MRVRRVESCVVVAGTLVCFACFKLSLKNFDLGVSLVNNVESAIYDLVVKIVQMASLCDCVLGCLGACACVCVCTLV